MRRPQGGQAAKEEIHKEHHTLNLVSTFRREAIP